MMKCITEWRPVHYIIYLRFYYYHWDDASADPRGITRSVVRVTDMMH